VAAQRQTTPRPKPERIRQPVVVLSLIGINALVYLATVVDARSVAHSYDSPLFNTLAMRPVDVAAGDWWGLVTSGFLHITPLHILMNMIALWVVGRNVELVLGRVWFSVVYGLSLIGGSVSVFLFAAPGGQVAGASGAIFGLMGAFAVVAFRLGVSLRPVLVVIALNLFLSVAIPGVSILGHLGGLVVGALVTAALIYAPRYRRLWWQAGAVAGLVVVLVALLLVRDSQLEMLAV
jgi:membrane associated rhomboid family serine protease